MHQRVIFLPTQPFEGIDMIENATSKRLAIEALLSDHGVNDPKKLAASIAAMFSKSAPSDQAAPPEYLETVQASDLLWSECGIRRSPKTLEKARSTGIGSPPFTKTVGGRVFYPRDALIAWGRARAQRSPLVQSTSAYRLDSERHNNDGDHQIVRSPPKPALSVRAPDSSRAVDDYDWQGY